MNNNQGSSVLDGLLSVDLISVGFVPFPALLIETALFFLRPLALRAIWWEEGGTFIHVTQCTFLYGDGDGLRLQFLSVSRRDKINHFFLHKAFS